MAKQNKEFEIRDFFFEAKSTYGFKYGKKELSIEGLRIDIFAIDENHTPYIIEFKKEKDRHIVGQAAMYLSLVPTYSEEIAKKINFYDIKWEKLTVLCIAPKFLERDYKAALNEPLKGRIHFYTFDIIQNSRKQVSSLNLNYQGPEENGPLTIPEKIVNKYDIKQIAEEYYKITKKEARREYYSQTILPFLQQIGKKLNDFSDVGLYPHYSHWDKWFTLRLGTDKKKSHRASVKIGFSETVWYGFDLTHSLEEGKKLSQHLQDEKIRKKIIKNILILKDYNLWIPNSGIKCYIPICHINEKGLEAMLLNYQPEKNSDCYFRIITDYKQEDMTIDDAVNLISEEYKKFKFIFDLLMQ